MPCPLAQLRERGKLDDLMRLYQGKNMHHSALTLLSANLDSALTDLVCSYPHGCFSVCRLVCVFVVF